MVDVAILDALRKINQQIVRTDSRPELEQAVCDVIVASTPYVFAWVGRYDADDDSVVPRASAGHEEGYLSEISITGGDEPTGQGPTSQALRTHEVQVVQNVSTDPDYGPWRAAASERGFQSSIAVPIVYEGTRYGVLNVYSDSVDAFSPNEQALFEELGQTIAHAINSIQVRTKQRQQYQNLFEQAPVMYTITRHEDGRAIVEDCNRRFLETLGYERDEVLDTPLSEFYTAESARRLREYGYQLALENEFIREQRSFRTADDDAVHTLMRAVPRIGTDGDVVGTLVLYVDVTKRKQAEAVLRHSEALEASRDGIAIYSDDWECIYANGAFLTLHGYEVQEEALGRPYGHFVSESERRQLAKSVLPAVERDGTWRGETVGLRTNGETFPAEQSLTKIDDAGFVCIERDVSGRKERERKLEEERKRYRTLMETAPDAIFVADADTGDIVEANAKAAELVGYSRDELVGMSQSQLHPDDEQHRSLFENHIQAIEESESGGVVLTQFDDGSDILIETRDGEQRPVEINSSLIAFDDARLIIGIFRDVTERKEYERRLEEQRDKLEVLNQVLRHDIRNDMQMVLGMNQMLHDYIDEEGQQFLEKALSRGEHVVELTRTARTLAKTMLRSESEQAPISIRSVIESQVDAIRSLHDHAVVTTDGTIPDVNVQADDMLDSVIHNFLQNAINHNDKDVPVVTVSATERADSVVVSVADNGPGIPDYRKRSIFGKGEKGLESAGTGLGLYLADTLVTQYGGDVWVEDNDPEGSVFYVELPKAEE